MSLKLFTLNIEGNRHLHRWPQAIRAEAPDLVCIQEIFEIDMPKVEKELSMRGAFFPMMNIGKENKYKISPRGMWGVAIFTKLPFAPGKEPIGLYYAKTADVQVFTAPNDASRVLVVGMVLKDGKKYTIGTTHFTWSGGATTTDEQRQDIVKFLEAVAQFPDIIFCGDFNAPRGGEIFTEIEKHYKDRLPKKVKTTIDLDLHYAASLYLVVDTIFSTQHYKFSNVHTKSGISDHIGIVGEVERVR